MTPKDRAAWRLVTSTGILTGFGHGFAAFAVSALLKPIALDLETGRGVVSAAIGLGRLVSGVVSPFVGGTADRWGSRPIVVAGMVVTAIGLAALGFVQRELELYLAWSLMVSAGVAAGFTVALDKLVISTNRDRRGMALAVRFSIAAVVATLLVPFVAMLVEAVGWRNACFIWAAVILLLLPVTLSFPKPEPATALAPIGSPVPSRHVFRGVAKHRAFWLIAFAFMAQAAVVTGLSVHLVPLMTDSGLDASLAGSIFGGMILLSIPARLATGQLADKAPAHVLPLLLAGLLAFEAMAIGSYAAFPSFATMLVLIVAQGIGAGAPTLVVLLICAQLFGEENFGSVQGLLMFFQIPGTALAPFLAGFAFDWYGDYRAATIGFALMLFLAAIALLFVESKQRE